MVDHDRPRDRQPQAGSLSLHRDCISGPEEAAEEVLLVLSPDPDAGVCDLDPGPVADVLQPDLDPARVKGLSTNTASTPSARAISWPTITPPIAGETTIPIRDRISSGIVAASPSARRAARSGSISTRAHCR